MSRMTDRMMSLAVTASGSLLLPVTVIPNDSGRPIHRVWEARTCSTSLVPIPKASAPERPVGGGVAVPADDDGFRAA